MIDRTCSSLLLIAAGLIALSYVRYARKHGPARFDRVDLACGGRRLANGTMQMGYWALQPLRRLCVRARVSANTITWASLVLALGAGALIAFGHDGLAAIVACASAIGDALDGMVARETGTASASGEVLDAASDRYAEAFFLGGVAIGEHQRPIVLALTLAALIGSFMVSYATSKAETFNLPPPRGVMRRPERAACLIVGATLTPLFDSAFIFPKFPLVASVALVAAVANVSAIARLQKIAHAVGGAIDPRCPPGIAQIAPPRSVGIQPRAPEQPHAPEPMSDSR